MSNTRKLSDRLDDLGDLLDLNAPDQGTPEPEVATPHVNTESSRAPSTPKLKSTPEKVTEASSSVGEGPPRSDPRPGPALVVAQPEVAVRPVFDPPYKATVVIKQSDIAHIETALITRRWADTGRKIPKSTLFAVLFTEVSRRLDPDRMDFESEGALRGEVRAALGWDSSE